MTSLRLTELSFSVLQLHRSIRLLRLNTAMFLTLFRVDCLTLRSLDCRDLIVLIQINVNIDFIFWSG